MSNTNQVNQDKKRKLSLIEDIQSNTLELKTLIDQGENHDNKRSNSQDYSLVSETADQSVYLIPNSELDKPLSTDSKETMRDLFTTYLVEMDGDPESNLMWVGDESFIAKTPEQRGKYSQTEERAKYYHSVWDRITDYFIGKDIEQYRFDCLKIPSKKRITAAYIMHVLI